MSITTRCTECGASTVSGILSHADTCTATKLNPPASTDYIRPPAIEMKFDSEAEQQEFMRKLTNGSGLADEGRIDTPSLANPPKTPPEATPQASTDWLFALLKQRHAPDYPEQDLRLLAHEIQARLDDAVLAGQVTQLQSLLAQAIDTEVPLGEVDGYEAHTPIRAVPVKVIKELIAQQKED